MRLVALFTLAGCASHAGAPDPTSTALPNPSPQSQACVDCHTAARVGVASIGEWQRSTHAAKGGGRYAGGASAPSTLARMPYGERPAGVYGAP